MLRCREAMSPSESVVGVSAGTAAAVGLESIRVADAPTTAYLMVGQHCQCDCAFCAQARHSTARSHFLSRVAWPLHPVEQTLHAITQSYAQRKVARCCLQVTSFPGHAQQALSLTEQLRSLCPVPISVSIALSSLDSIGELLDCGAQRVSLALDAACDRVHRQAKGGDWRGHLDLLRAAALRFPGQITTHLIVGLGEREEEMCSILQHMIDLRVTVGLFAFTPVRGTAWAQRVPPPLASYRRIQAARYLLSASFCHVDDFRFSPTGQLVSYGLSRERLRNLLADGQAFVTAGCPGCNRPYFNERPGKAMYNYPRPLSSDEVEAAVSLILDGLECALPIAAALPRCALTTCPSLHPSV